MIIMCFFNKNTDLVTSINENDHIQGHLSAPIQLVVYGDFGCPFTREARLTVKQLQEVFGDDLVYAYRHLPLLDKHPLAYDAARASEVASQHNKFWEMYDRLFVYQTQQSPSDLRSHAQAIGLSVEDFDAGMRLPQITQTIDQHMKVQNKVGQKYHQHFSSMISGIRYPLSNN